MLKWQAYRVEASEAPGHAARRANAHEFVLGLIYPDGRQGYDAQVGERVVKLSGGQRQRILVLDKPLRRSTRKSKQRYRKTCWS